MQSSSHTDRSCSYCFVFQHATEGTNINVVSSAFSTNLRAYASICPYCRNKQNTRSNSWCSRANAISIRLMHFPFLMTETDTLCLLYSEVLWGQFHLGKLNRKKPWVCALAWLSLSCSFSCRTFHSTLSPIPTIPSVVFDEESPPESNFPTFPLPWMSPPFPTKQPSTGSPTMAWYTANEYELDVSGFVFQ
jgi:hypothetical protein